MWVLTILKIPTFRPQALSLVQWNINRGAPTQESVQEFRLELIPGLHDLSAGIPRFWDQAQECTANSWVEGTFLHSCIPALRNQPRKRTGSNMVWQERHMIPGILGPGQECAGIPGLKMRSQGFLGLEIEPRNVQEPGFCRKLGYSCTSV